MAGMPSEDGLFLSATAMQWQALQKERATSVRSILKAVLNDDAYRERIPGAPPGSVLKRSLFAWCKDVGLGLHLHLEEAVSAGYLIQGGENPQEWLCVVSDWQPPMWEQGQGGDWDDEFGGEAQFHPLYKTQWCSSFLSPEGCRFGDQCNFAHSAEELRPPPQTHQPTGPPRGYSGPICRYFARGTCQWGDQCSFAHERPAGEMGRPPMVNLTLTLTLPSLSL